MSAGDRKSNPDGSHAAGASRSSSYHARALSMQSDASAVSPARRAYSSANSNPNALFECMP
jgi:hypothetical protein